MAGVVDRSAFDHEIIPHDAFKGCPQATTEHQQATGIGQQHRHGGQFFGTGGLAVLLGFLKSSGGRLFGFLLAVIVLFSHGYGCPCSCRMKSKVSRVYCSKCGRKLACSTQIANNPKIRPMGKPRAKMFICGAARVITPKEMLTMNTAVTAGSASRMADTNIQLIRWARSHTPAWPSPSMPMGMM